MAAISPRLPQDFLRFLFSFQKLENWKERNGSQLYFSDSKFINLNLIPLISILSLLEKLSKLNLNIFSLFFRRNTRKFQILVNIFFCHHKSSSNFLFKFLSFPFSKVPPRIIVYVVLLSFKNTSASIYVYVKHTVLFFVVNKLRFDPDRTLIF